MSLKQNIERLLILFCEDIKDYEYESSNLIGRDERSSEEFVKFFIDSNTEQFNQILHLIQQETDKRIEKALNMIEKEQNEYIEAAKTSTNFDISMICDSLDEIKNTLQLKTFNESPNASDKEEV